jgi:hypothetical protein
MDCRNLADVEVDKDLIISGMIKMKLLLSLSARIDEFFSILVKKFGSTMILPLRVSSRSWENRSRRVTSSLTKRGKFEKAQRERYH